MKRVLIIGGNGAGKTTFARKLAEQTRLPLVHLDRLYWRDDWQSASPEEFNHLLATELSKDVWILDGNILRTLPLRLQFCDTVLYFDFPRLLCLWGAIKRILSYYGKSRPDMGGFCPETFNRSERAFLTGIWRNHTAVRERMQEILSHAPDVRIIRFRNRRQAQRFLRQLKERNCQNSG
ncbi:MAG: AAA family ATPase [Candidatus Merdivicinus sp.]